MMLLNNLFPKKNFNNFIKFKIVDKRNKKYVLQCIFTKGLFRQVLGELIEDVDIINGLHPIQSCFIGLEASKEMCLHDTTYQPVTSPCIKRYGVFELLYLDRHQHICYKDITNGLQHNEPIKNVVGDDSKLEKFDANEAFYIGIWAGSRIFNDQQLRPPKLRIVK